MATIAYPYAPPSSTAKSHFSSIATHPLVESIAKVSAFAIAAIIALAIGWTSLAIPLFVVAGTMLAAQLAVKICNHYNVKSIYKIQLGALNFQRRHPYVQIIIFVFAMIMAPLSVVFASLLAATFGTFAGLVVGADHHKRAAAANLGQEKPNPVKI